MGLKKTDSISPKTQPFLYTDFFSIKDHNQTKQRFYTKRGIPNPQTSIHTKIHTKVFNKFHRKSKQSIPLLFFSPSFFLLFLPLLLLLLFSPYPFFPYPQRPKDIFGFKIRPCLALSHFLIIFPFFHVGPSSSFYLQVHLFKFYFGIQSFILMSFWSLIGNLPIYPRLLN